MPTLIDLCCGSGGWAEGFIAEGWTVYGYDIMDQPDYPGTLIIVDAKGLTAADLPPHDAIVGSPPCEQFSRHQMPCTRKRNPPPPDLSIVEACRRIAADSGKPFVMENVREAQNWIGRARWHIGPFYLWGDVPAIMPAITLPRKKESYGSKDRLKRARVPLELARYIARCFAPATGRECEFCTHQFPPELGRYGCPNCESEGLR